MQLTFDLPRRIALNRTDFLISNSNAAAMTWIDRWPDWPSRALALHGPAGCGKSHLVRLWCAETAGVMVPGEALSEEMVALLVSERRHRIAVDDADRASELGAAPPLQFLSGNPGRPFSGRSPAARLLDRRAARSRFAVARGLAIEIGLPDDALLGAVLVKHFADRQLRVAPEVIAYLLTHMERSFAAAAEMAARLDVVSLRERRAITVALARQLVSEAGDHSSSSARDSGVT